ncbi:MAG TPA: DMT family transporter [Dongiaceae bacterium]|nr:DMT family transporter [Dongiaceae bacterium]
MTSNSAAVSVNRHPVLAALVLCSGVMIFAGQDWIIKFLSGDYPVHEAIVIRCVVAVPILLVMIHVHGDLRDIFSPRMMWLALRGLILMASYTTYYLAFPAMPLANVVALWFTAPLFVTALAGPILGEHVGAKRWAAAIVGFVGVLIMTRPLTDQFNMASLLPIASALTYGVSALMARRMGATESAPVMSLYQNLVFMISALLMAAVLGSGAFAGSSDPSLDFLLRAWIVPSVRDLLLLGACGLIASAATVLLTQAYRMAEANFVTSFEYSAIIWATLGGYLIWHEIPDRFTLLGAALIVGAGLYMLFGARPAEAVRIDQV